MYVRAIRACVNLCILCVTSVISDEILRSSSLRLILSHRYQWKFSIISVILSSNNPRNFYCSILLLFKILSIFTRSLFDFFLSLCLSLPLSFSLSALLLSLYLHTVFFLSTFLFNRRSLLLDKRPQEIFSLCMHLFESFTIRFR